MACYNANTGSYVTLLTCLDDNPALFQTPRHRLHNVDSINKKLKFAEFFSY